MNGGFGYTQARIQARYGQLPAEPVWLQLASATAMGAYLEGARGTVLAPWVANLSGVSDVHDVEHSMRGTLAATIEEVARWMPEPWRLAMLWLLWIVYLPALRHLLEGGPVLRWMGEGHRLRPYLHPETVARRQPMVQAGAGPLVEAWELGRPLEAAWLEAWCGRWPPCGGRCAAPLTRLTEMLKAHARGFASLRPDQTWSSRQSLRQALRHFFRRHALQPAAAFSYLALVALDLEHLRAELTRRALFAPPEGSP